MWEEGYIGGRTSHRKSDFLFLGRVFSACPVGIIAKATAPESRVLGRDPTVRRSKKEARYRRPEKHANYSLVRKIGVSGLMIISRRRRHLRESISVECHNPEIHSSEHRGQGEIRKEYVVSCMWRETRNLWHCVIGLIALKYTAALAHTPRRMTTMKTEPHLGQQRWVPENLKRMGSAAEPGADIGIIVSAMLTTDDWIISANKYYYYLIFNLCWL